MVPFRKIKPMRTACLPIITILALTLISCSDSSKTDKEIIKEMEKSLERSNRFIGFSTDMHLRRLEEDEKDPVTTEKAKIWLPVAKEIADVSNKVYDNLEALRKLEKIGNKEADSLIGNLKQYEEKILSANERIKHEFAEWAIFQNDSFNKNGHKRKLISNNPASSHAFLTNIQNHFKRLENVTVTYCGEHINRHLRFDNFYSAIVSQNSTILKQNENLEIITGMGIFTAQASPTIFINGKKAESDGHAQFVRKIKVPSKPGNYSVPVKIKYFDHFGSEQTMERNVEYTVAKECDQ